MNLLNDLYSMIDENEMRLNNAELQQEGTRIIIIDDNAEASKRE